jgi:hypothetical protein
MPLDFPPSPALNEVYSLGGKSWKWNGAAWETYNDNLGVDFVETLNGLTGEVGVQGGTDISVVVSGKTLTVNYTGSSVSNAVTSFNGATGAVQGVSSVNGKTGAVKINTIAYRVTNDDSEVAGYGLNTPVFASPLSSEVGAGVTLVNVSVLYNSALDPRTLATTTKLYDGDRWMDNVRGRLYTWYNQPDDLSGTGLTGQWVEF